MEEGGTVEEEAVEEETVEEEAVEEMEEVASKLYSQYIHIPADYSDLDFDLFPVILLDGHSNVNLQA